MRRTTLIQRVIETVTHKKMKYYQIRASEHMSCSLHGCAIELWPLCLWLVGILGINAIKDQYELRKTLLIMIIMLYTNPKAFF